MKDVIRTVSRYPATWAAVAVIAVAEWVIISWFDPPLAITLVLIALGVLLLLAWPFTMSVTGTLERLRFAAAPLDNDTEVRAALVGDLGALGCEQGAGQVERLRGNLDDLTQVLKRRFDAGELTHSRYLSTAQRVYLAAINNLREVAVALSAVDSINPQYIDQRLRELRAADVVTRSDAEIAALSSRRSLREKQLAKVDTLLAQNEEAMTALSTTASAMADAPIGRTPAEAEVAMAELDNLAKRAARYASS